MKGRSRLALGSLLGLSALTFFAHGARATASAHDEDSSATEPRFIELYATCDIHGHLEPSAFRSHHGHEGVHQPPGGGLVWLGGLLKNARAHFGKRVLLLDGGDLFQGTIASNMTEGASMIRGLNQLGYAAAALGNHEFDYGPVGPAPTPTSPKDDARSALKARMKEANFPILSANVVDNAGGHPWQPYVVREIDGVPLGIVGGTTEALFSTTMRENLAGLKTLPLAPAVIEAGKEALAHGAKMLVATVHAGAECSRTPRTESDRDADDLGDCRKGNQEVIALAHALATSAANGGPRFSAIVAGHTHQPITIDVDGIPVVQSGQNGQYLSHVSLEVVGRGETAQPTGRFTIERTIEVCPMLDERGHCAGTNEAATHAHDYFGPVKPDPAVEAAIASDLSEAHRIADRKLGVTLPEGLSTTYGGESALGNFVADVIRNNTHADVGVMNGGGIRAALPVGPVTYGELYETFPFDNAIVLIELTGKQLQRLVDHNLVSPMGALSYSGIAVHAGCTSGKVGSQITFADGRVLDPNARYRVGTVDFLAHGGDEMLATPVLGEADSRRHAAPDGAKEGQGRVTVRSAIEAALAQHGGELRPKELFDPAKRRVDMPGPRPLRCKE